MINDDFDMVFIDISISKNKIKEFNKKLDEDSFRGDIISPIYLKEKELIKIFKLFFKRKFKKVDSYTKHYIINQRDHFCSKCDKFMKEEKYVIWGYTNVYGVADVCEECLVEFLKLLKKHNISFSNKIRQYIKHDI